jgi:hypothetical protein
VIQIEPARHSTRRPFLGVDVADAALVEAARAVDQVLVHFDRLL